MHLTSVHPIFKNFIFFLTSCSSRTERTMKNNFLPIFAGLLWFPCHCAVINPCFDALLGIENLQTPREFSRWLRKWVSRMPASVKVKLLRSADSSGTRGLYSAFPEQPRAPGENWGLKSSQADAACPFLTPWWMSGNIPGFSVALRLSKA